MLLADCEAASIAGNQKIPINLKFTLPELPCKDVNVDVEDVKIKNNQVEKRITKVPFLADYKREADKSGKWDGGVTEENAPVKYFM